MKASAMCPDCQGTIQMRGRRFRRCPCGSRSMPVCRGCLGDAACGCGAGVRPRIVRYTDAPVFRGLAVTEARRAGMGECRAVGNTITGHAAVFGMPSVNLGGFIEVIEPGAFD